MRIVNNRHFLACLFINRNAQLFSNIRKKSNRNLQHNLLKQQHDQNSDNSLMGKLPSQMWQLPKNKMETFKNEDHQNDSQGLKHLEEALKFQFASNEIVKMHLESGSISQQTKQNNSQTFIKLISHTLSRDICDQVINLIQVHCAQIKSQEQQKIGLINSSLRNYQSLKKNQEALFQKIQGIMFEEMLLDQSSKQDNTQYINNLLKILAESDLFSISHQLYAQINDIQDVEDYQPREIRNFLNSEYLTQAFKKNQITENQSQNKLEEALKIRQNQKVKIHVKTMKNKTTAHKEIKIKVAPQEDIFFNKVNNTQEQDSNQKLEQSRKYAYIYNLPFLVTNNQCKDFIQYLENTKGINIASHRLFAYSSYFQLNTKQKKFHIPQFYQTESSIEKIYEEVDLNMYLNSEKNSKKPKNKSKEQTTGLSWTTQALLRKIKKQKYSAFNRSVLVVKFQTEQEKKKWINPDTRLYGINYKNLKNITFEEGFSKTVVKVHGIPQGCTTTEINQFLNKTFERFGYRFQVENDLYLSKNYILIQFQHFIEVLKAIDLLQNQTFQEKMLKAEILYGPSKVFKENFRTNVNDSRAQLKKRVTEISQKYYQINEEIDQ